MKQFWREKKYITNFRRKITTEERALENFA